MTNFRQRLAALERNASPCPRCGAGGVINLLPIELDQQDDLPPASACPLCGTEPIRLGPIVLAGDKQVSA